MKIALCFDLDDTIYRESDYLVNVIIEFLKSINENINNKIITPEILEKNLNRRKPDILGQIINFLKLPKNIFFELHNKIYFFYENINTNIYPYKDFLEL